MIQRIAPLAVASAPRIKPDASEKHGLHKNLGAFVKVYPVK